MGVTDRMSCQTGPKGKKNGYESGWLCLTLFNDHVEWTTGG